MKYDYLDYEQIKKMGERIKISRKSNNMTQSELADILGISADQVSNIELGKSACKIDHIYLLMQVLDISADYLFGNFVNTNDMELWHPQKRHFHLMLLIMHRKNLRRTRIIMN